MITIRNYEGKDVYDVINVWNESLPYDTVSKLLFTRKILLDCNFDKNNFFIAEDDGKMCGFLYGCVRLVPADAGAVVEQDIGYIVAFGALKDYLETAGKMLLSAFEARMKELGRKTIKATGFSPAYFTQGYDEDRYPEYIKLFKDAGYTGASSISMEIDLSKYAKSDKVEEKRRRLKEEGIEIIPLSYEYIPAFLDASEPFNSPGWVAQYRRRLLLNNDFESVRIAVKDGRVIGAVIFGDPDSSPERFGPFGVNSEYQGKGIGTVLLSDCLCEMKSRNLHNSWMQWTSGTGASGTVYKRAGFVEGRRFMSFIKQI